MTSSTAAQWRPQRIRSTLAGQGGHVLDWVNHAGRNQGRLLIGTAAALLELLSVVSCSDPLRGGLSGTGGSAGGGGLPGAGGIVGTGGASTLGGSGGVTTGGMTGSGGNEARCPALPCPANPCPEGDMPLPLFDCNCSGPCGCWQCVSAPELSTGGTVSSGGATGSSGIGGTISHGGTSGPSGSGGVTSSGGSSGKCAGQAPINHRQSAVQCPSQRGPVPQFCPPSGTCTGQPYPSQVSGFHLTCSSDSQCTAGDSGRCFPPVFEPPSASTPGGCSYDECSADSDCGVRTPCICRSSSTVNSANICDAGGNCAVDSDCGPCGYCSPSRNACFVSSNPDDQAEGSGDPNPYYCHTASDLCINDSDCAQPDAGMASCPMFASCAYNVQDTRWECTQYSCCPP